jgi:hypothetical protein
MAVAALGHDAPMILVRLAELFAVLACCVARPAIPVRFPGYGLMVMTLDALPFVAVRMLGMLKHDIRPGGAAERDGLGGFRDHGRLARTMIRHIALGEKREEDENDDDTCWKPSLHINLLTGTPLELISTSR